MRSFLNYFCSIERLKRRRERYAKQHLVPDLLQEVLTTPALEGKAVSSSFDYIVLDIETTGLDSEADSILSLGWVKVTNHKVDLSTCRHFYINNCTQVRPETAIINHITPQMLASGVSLDEAMAQLFTTSRGTILVAHGCISEADFMARYLKVTFNVEDLPIVWLDTMNIEKSLSKAVSHDDDVDVTLSGTRQRYGLPEYNGHNALADAVATAELFLVQQSRLSSHQPVCLRTLHRLSQ